MGTFVWAPIPALPTDPAFGPDDVGSSINYVATGDFTPTGDTGETITAVTATITGFGAFDINAHLNLNTVFTGTTIETTLSGIVPIDGFDQYRVNYIDQGESDLSQTPVVSLIADVPSFKEVYWITVDPRVKLTGTLTITATVYDGITHVGDFSHDFTFDVTHIYDMIDQWTRTYFSTRY